MPIAEIFESAGYLMGFWLFVFNKTFRANWLSRFRSIGMRERFFACMDAIAAIFVGLLLPAWLVLCLIE